LNKGKGFTSLFFLYLFVGGACAKTLPWLSSAEQNGSFVQKKHLVVLSKPFVTKGTYQYKHATGLDWQTLTPITNHLNISVHGVIEIQSDGSRKTLTTDTRFSELLLAIFSGDQHKIEQQFSIEQTKDSLKLTPKSEQISDIFREISVQIENQSIQEITLFEPAGNSTQIILLAEKPFENQE
jgi:hypothetical protein